MQVRTKRSRPQAQKWWKFSDYVVRDGFIRPAPGAGPTTYDPWSDYWGRAKMAKREHQPPYQSLVALVKTFGVDYRGQPVATPESVAAILSWCRKYGLLGLLLQESRMVFFSPRSVLACGDPDPTASLEPAWALTHYSREPAAWHAHTRFRSPSYGEWTDLDFQEPDVTHFPAHRPSDEIPACPVPKHWPRPEVTASDLQSPGWYPSSLTKNWFSYFPDLKDQTQLTPIPLTSEFWSAYAEPLDAFVRAAVLLQIAVEGFTQPLKDHGRMGGGTFPDAPTKDRFGTYMYANPEDVLAGMLNGVTPTVETTKWKGEWKHRQVWKAPSLLGMFAAMFLTDLDEGRRVRACSGSGCPTIFLVGVHETEYCSERCRRRMIQRRAREKPVRARRLHAKGKKPAVIAKELNSSVEKVREWIKSAPAKKRRRPSTKP